MALLVRLPLLAAGPASAAGPAPLPFGSVRSVHPGDTPAVTATLRCDVASGLYPVYRHAPDQGRNRPNQPWARLRVAPASRASTCPA